MCANWFREPQGGKRHWVSVGVGMFTVIYAINGGSGRDSLAFLFMGLWIVGFAGAELLGTERAWEAGILRIVSFLCLLAEGGILVALLVTA